MPVAETPSPAALQQVARVDRLDAGLLERLRHEALTVPTDGSPSMAAINPVGGGHYRCSTIAVSLPR